MIDINCPECERLRETLAQRERYWDRIYQRLNNFWSKPAIRLAKEAEDLREVVKQLRRRSK